MSASPCSSTKAPWSPPQVLIDDNSERIIYTAGWFPAKGVTPAGWGSSLTDSTHQLALTDVSSGFSFNFTGTSVSLLGDVFSYSDNLGEATLEMDAICLIDGEQRGGLSGAPHLLCGIDNLSDGNHEISYSIRSVSTNSSLILYLDAIQYTPSPSTNSNGTNIYMVDSCDTSIDFGEDLKNWKAFNSTLTSVYTGLPLGFRERFDGITTNVAGTQLQYKFTGTKLQWMATILSPDEGGPSTTKASNAVFTIDSSPNSNWTVQVPWWSNETVYNQLVFETPEPLTSGEHTLSVTYLGDPESMPLSLSYFNVFDGVETASQSVKTSHSHLAPILGGALGGLVGLLLVMLTGWVTYHRRQRIMEKRAWDTTWQKRQPRVEALEMSPRPEKPEKS